jgi:hypothetical protein
MTLTDETLSDEQLVMQFESLGDNCELGIVQRRVGAEPLGLFRFAGAPLRNLIRGMSERFAGLADPSNVRVRPMNNEYMIDLTKFDYNYHANVKIGEADPVELLKQQLRTLPFLVGKLIDDLENPTKIFVFRQNEPLDANDLIDLRLALAEFGPSTLLWVQEARPGHPAGSVAVVDTRLMIGYVRRLALRGNVPDLDVPSWLTMLRNAHAMRPFEQGPASLSPRAAPARPSRVDIVFGAAGNAGACTQDGWSGLENGFTWAIGQSSTLTLPCPADAPSYTLEIDSIPHLAPPVLAKQRLSIVVNGTCVAAFDPLPRGLASCEVPAELLRDRDAVEIVLLHPDAASPLDVTGENDSRPLAIAFWRLSLIGA